MAKTLNVYLYGDKLVGYLIQDKSGLLKFKYDSKWLQSSGVIAISKSLPLTDKEFIDKKCRGFFGGILPA